MTLDSRMTHTSLIFDAWWITTISAYMTVERWTGLSCYVGRRAEWSIGTVVLLRNQFQLDVPDMKLYDGF